MQKLLQHLQHDEEGGGRERGREGGRGRGVVVLKIGIGQCRENAVTTVISYATSGGPLLVW